SARSTQCRFMAGRKTRRIRVLASTTNRPAAACRLPKCQTSRQRRKLRKGAAPALRETRSHVELAGANGTALRRKLSVLPRNVDPRMKALGRVAHPDLLLADPVFGVDLDALLP